MNKKEESEYYPLKSLHNFLGELDREWNKFRTASLIGIVSSGLLVVFLAMRILGLLYRIRMGELGRIEALSEFFFLVLIVVFVIYEIYLLLGQHKFFARWERRVGLLMHMEEKLMEKTESASIIVYPVFTVNCSSCLFASCQSLARSNDMGHSLLTRYSIILYS